MESPNPYAAPSLESNGDGPRGEASQGALQAGYEGQSGVVLALTGLLGLGALLDASNGATALALNTLNVSAEVENTIVETSGTIAMSANVVYYLTILPFAAFLVRANKNAMAIGRSPVSFTPSSMIWWFVVPFLSLVRPYQAVREVWDTSAPLDEDIVSPASGIVTLWWCAWLLHIVAVRIVTLATKDAEPATHNLVIALGSVIDLALCVAALWLVRALHDRQERRAAVFK